MSCQGTQSCSNWLLFNESWAYSDSGGVYLVVSASLASPNTLITSIQRYYRGYEERTVFWDIELCGYYSFYNTTLNINIYNWNWTAEQFDNKTRGCIITCTNSNPQLFYIEFNSPLLYCEFYNCKNETTIDPATLTFVQILSQMDEALAIAEDSEHGCNSDISIRLDIGYPSQVDKYILNQNMGGYICCRGVQSCFGAAAIRASFGDVICSAVEACRDTFIWNTDDSGGSQSQQVTTTQDPKNVADIGNVYCLAKDACYQSIIKSDGHVYCTTPDSCYGIIVEQASAVYCTTIDSCMDSNINHVPLIYMIDVQFGTSIFSGGVGKMTVYFRGENSGSGVNIYCGENDFCTIDCGSNSNKTCYDTNVYCFGKCIINCDDTLDACPKVVESRAPTMTPTSAPTSSPTDAPATGNELTEEDIEFTMQWTMMVICSVVVVIMISGHIESRYVSNNDRYSWKAILTFLLYTTDFFLDWFFAARLLLAIGDINFVLLFIFAVVFILVPLGANIVQLHNEITLWNYEAMDKENIFKYPRHSNQIVKTWISSRVKFIYVLSFICGSSFSTIALCNSNLFGWRVFSMGLSRRQLAVFRNKRIFSVVFLEVCNFETHACF